MKPIPLRRIFRTTTLDTDAKLVTTKSSKQCSRCLKELPATLEFFNRCVRKQYTDRFYLTSECKECNKKRSSKWYNKPDNKKRVSTNGKISHQRFRQRVLDYYSNGTFTCKCCNDNHTEFLTVDHINGGGNKHRKKEKLTSATDLYRWLVNNDFPEGFQILCFNCNVAKSIYGKCPHEKS